MKVLLAGATGFLGKPLVEAFLRAGDTCFILSRQPHCARSRLPGPAIVFSYKDSLPPVDAVVNLAGESIVGFWTAQKKASILSSRVNTTRHLVESMKEMSPPPTVFVSASAVGYYGDRPGEVLTEQSAADPQLFFRSRVCLDWEQAAQAAERIGIRTIRVRLSQVLDPGGGYLAKLLPLYRSGMCIGFQSPRSHFSWISLRDTLRLLDWVMRTPAIAGALNAAAPLETLAADFTKNLADSCGQKFLGVVPHWWLRLFLGEFAASLLDDQNVQPEKAIQSGFHFLDTDLKAFLMETVRAAPKRSRA